MPSYESNQEQLSKNLFGHKYRIHVMRAVLRVAPTVETPFSVTSLTHQMRGTNDYLPHNAIQQEISGLQILKMIQRARLLPVNSGTSKWFERTDSPLWDIMPPIEAALQGSQDR